MNSQNIKIRYMHFKLFIVCLFISAIGRVMAQVDSSRLTLAPDSFQSGIEASHENSYITILGGIGDFYPLVFEVSVVPYYMIRIHPKSNWGIEVSPKINVRMFQERSYPVRTPSYMPRVNFYYGMGKSFRSLRGLFLLFSWAHHSNGQSDSFYLDDSTTINTMSGNFATNFIEFGPFLNRKPKIRSFATDYLKLSGEFHYRQNRELEGKYGNFRLNFEFQSIAYPMLLLLNLKNNQGMDLASMKSKSSSIRISLKNTIIFGDKLNTKSFDLVRRINVSLTSSFRPKYLNDLTFFIQYYYGQDYYNIYFGETISVLRFGIQADTFNFFK